MKHQTTHQRKEKYKNATEKSFTNVLSWRNNHATIRGNEILNHLNIESAEFDENFAYNKQLNVNGGL